MALKMGRAAAHHSFRPQRFDGCGGSTQTCLAVLIMPVVSSPKHKGR